MYHGYSVSHEKFVWDARLETGVLDAFSKIWGTSNLLVSFDGINMTLPLPSTKRPKSGRWPHQDQDSRIRGFQCAQGIINLIDNGPQDGGLVVMRGSHNFNDEFFETHSMEKKEKWGKVPDDWHGFDDEEVAWFEERRCEIVKVEARAGDLIVWDSRTVHYNVLPEGEKARAVICEWFHLAIELY
jgi:ectoine hydroxylase-related dioxygenase (phytanoyl-CoA dioxygenase family)